MEFSGLRREVDVMSSNGDTCIQYTLRASDGARQKDSRFDVVFETHHRVFFRPGVRRDFYSTSDDNNLSIDIDTDNNCTLITRLSRC